MVTMDIRQIRYLVSAIEGGALSAAAKKQFVTVQAVSKAISELEHEIGAALLVRSNHGVKPTAVGSGFYIYAKEALSSFKTLEDFAANANVAPSEGRAVIALVSPPFQNSLVSLKRLSAFLGKRSGLDVEIILCPGADPLETLGENTVDAVCTIGEYSSPEADSLVIGSVPTGAVVSVNHPLAKRETVRLAELSAYPVCWTGMFDMINRSALTIFSERGLESPILETRSPSRSVPEELRTRQAYLFAVYLKSFGDGSRGYRAIPLDERDAAQIPLCLVTLKDSKSQAYQTFAASVNESLRLDALL